jgi:glycosyltransferase involved in cell wall biosynthesis
MNIVLCKTTFLGPISGADEIMLNYAVHLHKAGLKVRIVLLYPPPQNDPYSRRLQAAGVPVTIVNQHSYFFAFLQLLRSSSSILFFLFLIPRALRGRRRLWQLVVSLVTRLHTHKCRRYFAKHRPDLLHIFTPDSGAALLIQVGHELGIPALYHEMGTPKHMPMLTDYYRRLEMVLPLCTEVAALSPRLASEWGGRFPFLPSVSVLPLIMEPANDSHHDPYSQTAGDQVLFGFAARIEEGKAPLVFVDALATVRQNHSSAAAKIAGIGPQFSEVKGRARELALGNACRFVGHYSDPLSRAAFMKSLDVFVLPSLAEGTPNSIIEAMAHGLPVIATDVGGIPDIISADTGILVPRGDSAALADAMCELIGDAQRRKAMGEAARRRYEELFSPTAVVPLMLETYGRVTRNGHEFKAITENGNHPWASSRSQTPHVHQGT